MGETVLKKKLTISRILTDEGVIMPRLVEDRMATMLGMDRKGGRFCSVRKAGEKVTYLGIFLGNMPVGLSFPSDPETETLHIRPGNPNPCIFVPELGQLVYGIESWWGEINSPEDLRAITDADIENVWYVRAMREMEAREATKN